MPAYKSLDDLFAARDIKGLRVLVRCDLNVPITDGRVSDTTRLTRIAPTLDELARKGAKVVVLSHFGRPKKGPDPELSLSPVAAALASVLGEDVNFAGDCIGPTAAHAVSALPDGEVLVLENTRFYEEEEANDPTFAKAIASLGDVYVNDAFSCAHRAHASTEGIARLLPSYAGRCMEAELKALELALATPERPVVAIVGGSKVSSKLDLLGNLVTRVDALVIGGGMANTFLAAQGKSVGKSLCEHDLANTARDIIAKATAANCKILLPVDVVVASELKTGAATQTVSVDAVPDDKMILDVGGDTIAHLSGWFETAKTIVWNGPLGAFEFPPFDEGTNAAARLVATLTKKGQLRSVAGGGDTVAALNNAGAADDFSYVSTAGGAFLEWLEGKVLPGVAALENNAG